ncbi:uncharacterized protein APUU_40416S [Aspergillus puulaauensis]|uniref:Uncharacterized protein n=1 Tax=Aspergillus puulaauensis TaxID=1220207 RepID=A0A7R7XMN4_9EURO|nr:uncharacterized protein APUU_40416S [Aspergillus puulaauensis]BCS23972.1 hypothetical protein APUU_40416S [Aspergillus puulaauensis]
MTIPVFGVLFAFKIIERHIQRTLGSRNVAYLRSKLTLTCFCFYFILFSFTFTPNDTPPEISGYRDGSKTSDTTATSLEQLFSTHRLQSACVILLEPTLSLILLCLQRILHGPPIRLDTSSSYFYDTSSASIFFSKTFLFDLPSFNPPPRFRV